MAAKEYDHDPGDDKDVTVVMWKLTKKEWDRIRAQVKDPAGLCDSYEDWLAREKTQREKHVEKGYRVVDVAIDTDAALAWCKAEKQPVTLKSFSRYCLKAYSPRTRGDSAQQKS